MEKSKPAISVSNVSKLYTIGSKKEDSLRGSLANLFSSALKHGNEFWALKDMSFDVNKGDVIGIIGKNGAGKSTLLKVLSRITKPTKGRIEIDGRVASLLEVGTGFHPELTGRENIFLNGTILGMSRSEVKNKINDIIEFSGIEKFIDTPVKHYSSGMYVRLAFSVAAHLEPEILIIDEVLAVGDVEFQKKCIGKMKDVSGSGRTIIFVSHNMAAIQNLCQKCIVMDKGQMIFSGNTDEAVKHYLSYNLSRTSTKLVERTDRQNGQNFRFSSFQIEDELNNQIHAITTGMQSQFNIGYNLKASMNIIGIRLLIKDEFETIRAVCNPALLNRTPKQLEKTENAHIIFKFPKFPFPKGKYHVHLTAYSADGVADNIEHAAEFEVEGGDYYGTGREAYVKDGVLIDFDFSFNNS